MAEQNGTDEDPTVARGKVHAAEYAWADSQVDYGKIRRMVEDAHLVEDEG